jgi:chromosome segregation ATPase
VAKKTDFSKVIKMIDDMVALLKKEQIDDDNKKEYCLVQFDQSDDKKKAVERRLADETAAIAATEKAIQTLSDEIAALKAAIVALDKAVADATEQRKQEHADFNNLVAEDTAAKELLKWARNRLNKFYNPKLYVAPAKTELTAEGRIAESISGTEAPTAAPGGIANTGIAVFSEVSEHVKPPPPPETFGAYKKKSGASQGVIEMIDLLIADLDKELTEATTTEKDAQADYIQLMADSAAKRAADSKMLSDKIQAKTDAEAALAAHTQAQKDAKGELAATLEYIASLHAECDWLLKFFEVRKEARAGEVQSLVDAKAVLSGADYSLLQMRSS